MRQRYVRVAEHAAAPAAHLVAALDTGATVPTRDQGLDGDAIAGVDAPAFCGTVTDLLDDAERLVPRDHRQAHRQRAGVLLDVAAADAARFNAQQRAVVVDLGNRELAQLQLARPGLYDGSRGAGRHAMTSCERGDAARNAAPLPTRRESWLSINARRTQACLQRRCFIPSHHGRARNSTATGTTRMCPDPPVA